MILILSDTLSCLQEFYKSTNGDQWTVNENWNTTDYCSFYGIRCIKNTTQIQRVEMMLNNLSGTLPSCLADLEVIEYSLAGSAMSGIIPNVSSVTKVIDFRLGNFSSLPLNWCDEQREGIYVSGNLPLKGYNVKACYFKTYNIDFDDLGMVSQGMVKFGGKSLKANGNNLTNLIIDFADQARLYAISLQNTHVKCTEKINLNLAVNLTMLSIANTEIMVFGEYPPHLYNLDLTNAIDERVFTFSELRTDLIQYAAKNSGKCGLAPTIEEFDAYMLKNPEIVIDLSENNFFCRPEESIFDCQFASIRSGSVSHNNQYQIVFELDHPMPLNIIDPHLKVAYRYNNEIISDFAFQSFQDGNLYFMEFPIEHELTFENLHENFAILFDDVQISTGAMFLQAEIDQKFASIVEDIEEEISSSSFIAAKKTPKEFKFSVTAMSNCGDYKRLIEYSINPFKRAYPQLFKLFDYKFVSMSSPNKQEYLQADSMHGPREVYDDYVLMCANEILDDFKYIDFTACFTSNLYNYKQCLQDVLLGSERTEILFCVENERDVYLNKEYNINENFLLSSWCPSIYFGTADYSDFVAMNNSTPHVDELRDFVCKYMNITDGDCAT